MTQSALKLASDLLWLVLRLSIPTTCATGLSAITGSLLQILVHQSDQIFQGLVKFGSVLFVLSFTYSWMLGTLLTYSESMFEAIRHLH